MSRVKLSEYKERKRAEGGVEVEADDGTVFVVDPPELWSDEVLELSQAGDNFAAARGLLGDQYEAFTAAGGSAATLLGILKEAKGLDVGESQASSSS